VDSIKEGQERLLLRIIEKIKTGLAMYEKLPVKEYGDNRINLADSRHHLGMAYQYLGDNKSAIEEWRSSLDIYREIFDEYSSPLSSMDMVGISSVADIATSLITTSQQCGDALLMLGEYEETKEMYKFNLKLRRYLDDGTSIEQDLNRDGEDAEADFDESDWDNPQYGQFPSFATTVIDESIHQHNVLLNEYYAMLQNNPAGSYHEVAFDADGSQVSSIAASDKIYEGSLKAVIGSLYLSKNEVRAARDELELAVSMLRKGIEDEASGMWDTPVMDVDGNEISIPLYLADALLNLSYAQSGMRQWQKSMASFEDAVDIFKNEIPEGESPFGYKNKGSEGSDEPLQRDGLMERLKSRFSITVENYDVKSNSTSAGRDEL
jgi:tetratricopeptide (TPR) repeat protein